MWFSTHIFDFEASYAHAALATQLCAYFADFKGGTDGAVLHLCMIKKFDYHVNVRHFCLLKFRKLSKYGMKGAVFAKFRNSRHIF